MKTEDIVLLAVTLVILAEVTYLLAKLPKTRLNAKDRAILIDTSVLMDGRLISIAATGFIGGTLVIPRSVVGELQLLADGSDSDKRSRARYGLDVVTDLQKLEGVTVELLQDGSRADEGVDERLLTLAKRHNAAICTLDFNLNKVAAVEGIQVLNINELAQGLRMSHLPGDHVLIDLVQKGQDTHQAVGYLPDGTMVVVEQSNAYIGKTVEVEVIRSLQTAAGKMMFARRLDTAKKNTSASLPSGRRPSTVVSNTPVRDLPQASRSAHMASPRSNTKPRHPETQDSQERTHTPRKRQQGSPKSVPNGAPLNPVHKSAAAAQPVKARQTTASTPKRVPSSQPQRRNNRRPDREAALIALVNKQD